MLHALLLASTRGCKREAKKDVLRFGTGKNSEGAGHRPGSGNAKESPKSGADVGKGILGCF